MKFIILLFAIATLASCSSKQKIDLLVYNATIYTVDSNFSKAEAVAVDKGKIVEVGKTADLQKKYNATENVDADGKYLFPGLIDAHAHFLGYGLGLQTADLTGTDSWDEIIEKLKAFDAENKDGWLEGRGWDQNDWKVKDFPTNEKLNELFPDRPVVLTRVDGHAVIANQKALDLAGIKVGDHISGGEIEVINGKLTGILVDNATELVSSKIPAPSINQLKEALLDAQKNCFAAGLTTIDDCGLDYRVALLIDSLQKNNELKMRLFVMLSDAKQNFDFLFSNGKIKTDRLNVRSFKVYADGALGSRGACLLQPYSDKPGWNGFL
ncbi:MAG: amidohydrolase family protein, partial [Ginsengibacter sp.]